MALIEFIRVETDAGETFSSASVSLSVGQKVRLTPGPMSRLTHGGWRKTKFKLYTAITKAKEVKIYGFFGSCEAFLCFNPQDSVEILNTEGCIEIRIPAQVR